MKVKFILIAILLSMVSTAFGQLPQPGMDGKEYCSIIKDFILADDHTRTVANYFVLQHADSDKLKDVISSYSNAIKNGDFTFNEYQRYNEFESDSKAAAFGYRWATSANQTLYTIEIVTILVNKNHLIDSLIFTSYDKNIQTLSIPGGEIIGGLPPSFPPPPTPLASNPTKMTDQPKPTTDDLIQAFEKQIKFYKTASKEELVEFLGISPERVKSTSDEEFNDMVRDENAYLYENLIESFKKDEAEFEVLSQEGDFYTISIKEKGNNSMEIRMNFENTENGFVVARKNR